MKDDYGMRLSSLDFGCGRGRCGHLLRTFSAFLCGIDLFTPSLTTAQNTSTYDALIRADLSSSLPFKDRVFDLAVGFEVLEHLSKDDGMTLLSEIERVTRTIIILSTPNIWKQKLDVAEHDRNAFMKHKSIWSVAELKKRGYEVHGIGLKGHKQIDMWALLTWKMPVFSKRLFAWKTLGEHKCTS